MLATEFWGYRINSIRVKTYPWSFIAWRKRTRQLVALLFVLSVFTYLLMYLGCPSRRCIVKTLFRSWSWKNDVNRKVSHQAFPYTFFSIELWKSIFDLLKRLILKRCLAQFFSRFVWNGVQIKLVYNIWTKDLFKAFVHWFPFHAKSSRRK